MKADTSPDITKLIEIAKQILSDKGAPLEWHEEAILKHVLSGKPLKAAKAGDYESSTIERIIAPKLWKRFGEQVRCKNIRLFLEDALTHQQSATSPLEVSHSEFSSRSIASSDTFSNSAQDTLKRVFHNLPHPQYSKFVGRQSEVARIFKYLAPKHPIHKICLTGIGGVGKTSLALACARKCLEASCAPQPVANIPVFDLIIFVTAKQQILDCDGLYQRRVNHQTDLVRQIINVLDRNGLLQGESSVSTFEEQIALIYNVLEKYQTLLIMDNLEAVENWKDIKEFLGDLPLSVKSIITTREGSIGDGISLTALPQQDGVNLLQHRAEIMGVRGLSSEHCQMLYQLTGGLPLAIHLVIGQLYKGHSLKRVQEQLLQPTGNLAQYCLANSVQSIQNRPAYWLLLATTLFPEPALRDALIAVAIPDLDRDTAEDELVYLQDISLVNQENSPIESHSRYSIIEPTRVYLLAQLQSQPQFEQEARGRWLNWYVKFSEKYCDQDPTEWQGKFDGLDREWENIQAVADWCMQDRDRYPELLQLWRNLKPYFYMIGRGANGMRFWNIGLAWAEWLIDMADQQQDWQLAGTVRFFRAWVLIGTNNPDVLPEAGHLLEEAWSLRKHQNNLKEHVNIATQIGFLNIKCHEFVQAQTWLQQAEEVLQQADLGDRKHLECLGYIRYYQGCAYFDHGNIDAAKTCFEEAHQYATSIPLDRFIQVIENSQADVAICQGELTIAKTLLEKGLRSAEANRDQSRVAAIKRSLAKLAQAEGNFAKKRRDATESLKIFEQLGMITEMKEVQALLESDSSTKKRSRLSPTNKIGLA